jgi:hypothetical protein
MSVRVMQQRHAGKRERPVYNVRLKRLFPGSDFCAQMYGIFRDLMYKVPARALQESVGDRVSNFFNGTQAINTGSCSCHFASARKDKLTEFVSKRPGAGSFFFGLDRR